MNKDKLLQDALVTINRLNKQLEACTQGAQANNRKKDREIAIVGMACQFPGAPNLQAFWEQLLSQFDGVTHYPRSRLALLGLNEHDLDYDIETIYGGYLEDLDLFDPDLFKISPREARCMDPQQRLLMMNVHQAVLDAGIREHSNFKNTGVFISHYASQYLALNDQHNPENALFMATGNASSISANRISYHYGLEGPSMIVDSACSSSLASIDIACRYLIEGRIDYALVGAISLNINPDVTKLLQHANMLAKDGKCKTFDERADGYVPGEGVGVIVLQRLVDNVCPSEKIYSIIMASYINQDGQSNGLTAPNGLAQEEVIKKACESANIHPEAVHYVETHGTGTYLGDPVEIEALGNVISQNRNPETPCILGCLKTNIGHLEPAAGIASIIKASLCIHLGKVPGNNHLKKINPLLDMDKYSFILPKQAIDWPQSNKVAGVSSFGFGGLNGFTLLKSVPQEMASRTRHTLNDYPLYDFKLGSYWIDRPPSHKTFAKKSKAKNGKFLEYYLSDSPTELFRVSLTIDKWNLPGIGDTGNFHIGFYIETLYKVFSDYFDAKEIHIAHITFLQALLISQQTDTLIQIIVQPAVDHYHHLDVYFKYALENSKWVLAAQASVAFGIRGDQPLMTIKQPEKQTLAMLTEQEFYERYESMGLPGKGSVRVVEHSTVYKKESYSTLALSFNSIDYKLGAHPGFLDAVLQPAFMMIDPSIKVPYMATSVQDIKIYTPLNNNKKYQLYNRLLSIKEPNTSQFEASWTIFDSDNNICIDCKKTSLKKLTEDNTRDSSSFFSSNQATQMTPALFLKYIADRLGTDPDKVRKNIPLLELGMDSLMIMSIRAIMDKMSIPIHDLFNVTVNDLMNMIGDKENKSLSVKPAAVPLNRSLKECSLNKRKWIRGKNKKMAGLQLYCFPYGHLSASMFRNWVKKFPDEIQVRPIELPGHGDRLAERPIEFAEEIAEMLTLILGDDLEQPFALFGHSSGALIAYAWSLYLHKMNKPMPEKLIASAFTSPSIVPNPVIRMAAEQYQGEGIDHIPILKEVLDPHNGELVRKIIKLQDKVTREYGLVSLSRELIYAQLHSIVAIMRAVSTFDPDSIKPLPLPIIAFHGESDAQVTYEEMQAWKELTTKSFSVKVFPGDHLFINPDQSEELVMASIRNILLDETEKVGAAIG